MTQFPFVQESLSKYLINLISETDKSHLNWVKAKNGIEENFGYHVAISVMIRAKIVHDARGSDTFL